MSSPSTVLGVPKTATVGEIRRQYKKLARQFHPDKNPDPNSKQRFQEIQGAYEQMIKTASTREQIPKAPESSSQAWAANNSAQPQQSMENWYKTPNPDFRCMKALATNLRFESHEVHNMWKELKWHLSMYGFGESKEKNILEGALLHAQPIANAMYAHVIGLNNDEHFQTSIWNRQTNAVGDIQNKMLKLLELLTRTRTRFDVTLPLFHRGMNSFDRGLVSINMELLAELHSG
jgi:hypothetical protein